MRINRLDLEQLVKELLPVITPGGFDWRNPSKKFTSRIYEHDEAIPGAIEILEKHGIVNKEGQEHYTKASFHNKLLESGDPISSVAHRFRVDHKFILDSKIYGCEFCSGIREDYGVVNYEFLKHLGNLLNISNVNNIIVIYGNQSLGYQACFIDKVYFFKAIVPQGRFTYNEYEQIQSSIKRYWPSIRVTYQEISNKGSKTPFGIFNKSALKDLDRFIIDIKNSKTLFD